MGKDDFYMKKIKSFIIFTALVMTFAAIFCFGASAESEISSRFDYQSGTLYVSGKGEVKNLYNPSWYEFEEDDCEHEADVLCIWCLEYRVKNVIIGEGITAIDHSFFNLYNLKTLSLPSTLKEIKNGSFIECNNLKSVDIPEGVTVIDNAFNYCTGLEWVNIPENVEVLCGFGYAKLKNIEIPRSVKKLALACDTLETIYIPETVTADMLKAEGYVNDYAEGDTKESTFSGIHTNAKFLTVTGYDLSAAKTWAKEYGHFFNEISPVPEKITVKNYVKHVLISWEKVDKTDTWILYRQAKGKTGWKRIATLDSNVTSFKDTTAQYGKTYTYSLKADTNKIYTKAVIGRIARPENVSMYATSVSKATITWDKVANAKYYYVYQVTNNGNGTVYKKVAKVNAKNNYYNFKNVNYDYHTNEHYCVRAYDGTSYSPYSKSVEFTPGLVKLVSATGNQKTGKVTLKWITSENIKKIDVVVSYYDKGDSFIKNKKITLKNSQLKKSGKYTTVTLDLGGPFTREQYNRMSFYLNVEYKEKRSSTKRPVDITTNSVNWFMYS